MSPTSLRSPARQKILCKRSQAIVEGTELILPDVHLWGGVKRPYLYTAVATFTVDGKEVDREVSHDLPRLGPGADGQAG